MNEQGFYSTLKLEECFWQNNSSQDSYEALLVIPCEAPAASATTNDLCHHHAIARQQ